MRRAISIQTVKLSFSATERHYLMNPFLIPLAAEFKGCHGYPSPSRTPAFFALEPLKQVRFMGGEDKLTFDPPRSQQQRWWVGGLEKRLVNLDDPGWRWEQGSLAERPDSVRGRQLLSCFPDSASLCVRSLQSSPPSLVKMTGASRVPARVRAWSRQTWVKSSEETVRLPENSRKQIVTIIIIKNIFNT